MMEPRELICRRVAKEFEDGHVINLGIGLPTFVANYIPEDIHVVFQSENGMLGLGGKVGEGETPDPNVTDSGGAFVKIQPGGCFFDSATSFAIIRGGHVDVTVLGALEVDQEGNLASWMIPGKRATGMGGAMDLVVGAKKVIIAMEHCTKKGDAKIVGKCAMPLTAVGVVDLVVTELGVFEVLPGKGIALKEIAPEVTLEEVKAKTGVELIVPDDLKVMAV